MIEPFNEWKKNFDKEMEKVEQERIKRNTASKEEQ